MKKQRIYCGARTKDFGSVFEKFKHHESRLLRSIDTKTCKATALHNARCKAISENPKGTMWTF